MATSTYSPLICSSPLYLPSPRPYPSTTASDCRLAPAAMIKQLESMRKDRVRNGNYLVAPPTPTPPARHIKTSPRTSASPECNYEVVALHISPDLGERIMLSAERALLDELFPEASQATQSSRSGVSWNQGDWGQIIRFPLNGYCKLNSVQVLTRLLNAGFTIEASVGGQQFSEYLLARRVPM